MVVNSEVGLGADPSSKVFNSSTVFFFISLRAFNVCIPISTHVELSHETFAESEKKRRQRVEPIWRELQTQTHQI